MTSKTTWNTGNNLLNNAVLNKLHTPRNQASRDTNKITAPGQHELMPLVRESMQRNLDAENVNEMLPDLDFVADIVVSGILSSKDLITIAPIFSANTDKIDMELRAQLVAEVKEFFTTTYPLKNYMREIVNDTLFVTGSWGAAIIPESSVDAIINEGGKIGIENYAEKAKHLFAPKGILGDPNATTDMNGFGFESLAFKPIVGTADNGGYRFTISGNTEGLSDDKKITATFNLTDNIDILKLPKVQNRINKAAVERTYNSGRFGLERAMNDFEYYDRDVYKSKTFSMKAVEEIKPVESAGRRSIGHPLVQHIPSEAIIPIHTPGTFNSPVGFFIMLDEVGNPISRNSNLYNSTAMSWMMGNPTSQMISDAALGLGMGDTKDWTMARLQDAFSELVEAKLITALKNGGGSEALNLVRPQQVYQIMLARALAKKGTQILYVPSEQFVYYAMDWTKEGIGRSRLDKGRIISGIRSAILMATMQATVLNATRNVKIDIELAPEDREPEKRIEKVQHLMMEQFANRIPFTGTPDDMLAYIKNAGIEFNITGNDYYPTTKVDVTDNSPDYKVPDKDLDESIAKRQYRQLGADPDLIITPQAIEFATQVTSKDLLTAKRYIQDQLALVPFMSHHIRTYIYSDPVLIDRLAEICEKYYEDLVKQRIAARKAEQAKAEAAAAGLDGEEMGVDTEASEGSEDEGMVTDDQIGIEIFSEGAPTTIEGIPTGGTLKEMVKKILSHFISHLEVSLPAPDTSSLNSQMQVMEEKIQGLDKILENWWADGMFADTELDGQESKIRMLVRSFVITQWLIENDVEPEMLNFLTSEDASEIVTQLSSNMVDRSKIAMQLFKRFTGKMETLAKQMDMEGGGDTGGFGGGDDGMDGGFGDDGEGNEEGNDDGMGGGDDNLDFDEDMGGENNDTDTENDDGGNDNDDTSSDVDTADADNNNEEEENNQSDTDNNDNEDEEKETRF